MIKERNSESISYPNFCSVRVLGEKIEIVKHVPNFKDVEIVFGSKINDASEGSLRWTSPHVNNTFVAQNFDKLFDVYIKNVTYKFHNTYYNLSAPLEFIKNKTDLSTTRKLQEVAATETKNTTTSTEVAVEDDEEEDLYFKAKFYRPYMLGLLVKKRDILYYKFKKELLNQTGQFKDEKTFYHFYNEDPRVNRTEMRLFAPECVVERLPLEDGSDPPPLPANNTCEKDILKQSKIELQFDFRDPIMSYFRDLAQKMYWYICFIIIF